MLYVRLGHLNGSFTQIKLITISPFEDWLSLHCEILFKCDINDSGTDFMILYSNDLGFIVFSVQINHRFMVSLLSVPVKLILKVYLHREPCLT
jgi:hypothetical protein